MSENGHWECVCHSKTVIEVTEEVKQLYFLGEVGTKNSKDDWTVSLTIGNTPDTGADATVITKRTFEKI